MKLPPDAESLFQSVFVKRIQNGMQPETYQQHHDIVRNAYYYRGQQYLVPTTINGVITYAPLGSSLVPSLQNDNQEDQYDTRVTNIYKGEARKIINILGQRDPNINVVSATKSNPDHQRRAQIGDEINGHLSKMWEVGTLHARAVYRMVNHSQVYLYTPWVTDREKYGVTKVPVLENRMQTIGADIGECSICGWVGEIPPDSSLECPECGGPLDVSMAPEEEVTIQVDEREYENGAVECHLFSALEVTHDESITDLSEAQWLDLDLEMDRGVLIQKYPHLRDYLRTNSSLGMTNSPDMTGRSARDKVMNRSRDGLVQSQYKDKAPYKRRWIRPSQYNYIDPDHKITIDGQKRNTIEWLRATFPDGLKICIVGTEIAGVYNASIDYEWAAAPTEATESLCTPAYIDDMIECQDSFNDRLEIAREADERSIPFTIANPTVLRPDTLDRIGRRVGEFVFAEPAAGDYGRSFYKVAGADPLPHIHKSAVAELDIYRQITGITEALFGASSAATLGEAEMNRNQALTVLALSWFFLRKLWERAKRNAIMQVVRNSHDGLIYYPKHLDPFRKGVELPRGYETLMDGGWDVESDESLPVTIAQIRTWIFQMLESPNTDIPELLGMFSNDNLGIMADVFGIPGWTLPKHKAAMAVHEIIQRLLQAEPVEDYDPQTGLPIEVPSESPDSYLIDPAFAEQAIRDWLLSDQGRKEQETNPAGWQNAYLYGRQLWQSMQAPPPEEGMPAEDGAPPQDQGQPPMEQPIATPQMIQ